MTRKLRCRPQAPGGGVSQEKNAPEYRSCQRKRAYTSRSFAEAVAVKRWKRSGFLLTIYHCDHCGKFHLTRFPPRATP